MKRINLLDVQDVICAKSSPLWNNTTVLMLPDEHIIVPRAVMVGLGTFITISDNHVSREMSLTYDGYEFYIQGPFKKHATDAIVAMWKYLTDAGLEYMSKVCSHDFSKLEHFYRRKNERLPFEVDGYQTKVVVDPTNYDKLTAVLHIRQTLVRTDMMVLANSSNRTGDVVNLNAPAAQYDFQQLAH